MTRAVFAALALAACTSEASIGAVREHPVVAPDKLDLLFVIDRSQSMSSKQFELAANLPRFMDRIEQLAGGLPSLHVGVITSDLGAGPHVVDSCGVVGGDGGELQAAPRVAGCDPPDGAFIVDDLDDAGGRVRNYRGTLAEAFTCIALVGSGGCGFEQPLAALQRALDGSVARNAGFLRDDAFLAVVFLTDEDDCSASDPAALFDPAPSVEATLGPFGSFRCTRWGVSCDGHDLDAPGEYRDCAPRAGRYVTHTDQFAGFVELIKDRRAVYVAVVAGPATPVEVRTNAAARLALAPACMHESWLAQPAPRLGAFADRLPHHAFHSICEDDLPDVLVALGGDVSKMIVAYDSDQRDDLDISYGCSAGGHAAPCGAWLALALLALVRRFR